MSKKKKRGGKGRFRSKGRISAQIGLGSLINKAGKDSSFRNEPAGVTSVIQDMPEKFQDNFQGVTNYEDMNEAQKSIFNFYNDGRSEFQRQLNRGIQSNPQFAKEYAERFPKTALAMKGLPLIFKGVAGAVAPGFNFMSQAFQSGKDTASNIGTSIQESLQPTFDGLKELFTPDLKSSSTTDAALNVKGDGIDIFTPDVQTDFVSAPTSLANNPELQRIFALPSGQTASFATQSLTDPTKANMTRGNYLVNDPGGFLRMANLPIGMAEGGIASLQDPNYNLLMEASDFSL